METPEVAYHVINIPYSPFEVRKTLRWTSRQHVIRDLKGGWRGIWLPWHNIEPQNKNRKISNAIYRKTEYRGRKISMGQNIESAEYRVAKYRMCMISNRKVSNTLNIVRQNIRSKISKGENIERAECPYTKHRRAKISNAIYQSGKISKRQNIENKISKWQDDECKISEWQNIERKISKWQNIDHKITKWLSIENRNWNLHSSQCQ